MLKTNKLLPKMGKSDVKENTIKNYSSFFFALSIKRYFERCFIIVIVIVSKESGK